MIRSTLINMPGAPLSGQAAKQTGIEQRCVDGFVWICMDFDGYAYH